MSPSPVSSTQPIVGSSRIRANASMSSRDGLGPEGVVDLGPVDRDLRDARCRSARSGCPRSRRRTSRSRRRSCGWVLLQEVEWRGVRNASGVRGAGCGRRRRRRRVGHRGSRRRPGRARARPTVSSAPAMTSVGAPTRRGGRASGSIAPWPAPRRLAGEPVRVGCARRIARGSGRRAPAAARASPANTGSRSHSATKASMPSRSSRVARAPRPRRGARRAASVGDAGGRALEHEPADDVRVRDREPEGDPGPERVADDVRRRGAEPARIAARSSAVARRGAARVGRASATGRGPGRSTTIDAERAARRPSRGRPTPRRAR